MMKNIKDLTNDYNLLNKKVADLVRGKWYSYKF